MSLEGKVLGIHYKAAEEVFRKWLFKSANDASKHYLLVLSGEILIQELRSISVNLFFLYREDRPHLCIQDGCQVTELCLYIFQKEDSVPKLVVHGHSNLMNKFVLGIEFDEEIRNYRIVGWRSTSIIKECLLLNRLDFQGIYLLKDQLDLDGL